MSDVPGAAPANLPRFDVIVTGVAMRDIEEAHRYFVETVGFEIADLWERGVYNALRPLRETPRREQDATASRAWGVPVHRLIYRRTVASVAYRVLFLVEDDPGAPSGFGYVRVVAVRHAARRPIARKEAREHRLKAEDETQSGNGRA